MNFNNCNIIMVDQHYCDYYCVLFCVTMVTLHKLCCDIVCLSMWLGTVSSLAMYCILQSVDRLLNVYINCMRATTHNDHRWVTAWAKRRASSCGSTRHEMRRTCQIETLVLLCSVTAIAWDWVGLSLIWDPLPNNWVAVRRHLGRTTGLYRKGVRHETRRYL